MKEHLVNMASAMKRLHFNSSAQYVCFEEFVLIHGKEYSEVTDKKVKRGRMKECFKNAYHLAEKEGLTYVEGFACGEIGFPVLHAWCVDDEGKVHDPTWKDGVEYYGVPFSIEFVRKTIFKRKAYGVIDNMENGFPLLMGKEMNFLKGGEVAW